MNRAAGPRLEGSTKPPSARGESERERERKRARESERESERERERARESERERERERETRGYEPFNLDASAYRPPSTRVVKVVV